MLAPLIVPPLTSTVSLALRPLPAGLRASFDSGVTRDREWRLHELRQLRSMVSANEAVILEAVRSDIGKPAAEVRITETDFLESEIQYAITHLRRWMKPRRVRLPLAALPGKGYIVAEPLGVALIIAPWNCPIGLALAPLVGAITAGNCAVLKPSELAPASSSLLAELVPRYLDTTCFAVVEGGVPETTALLEQRFDHIFYTGSAAVGRIVMTAAAKHLTPVTLELGGKSPCVVDADVDLDVAARRIAWAKFSTAGQVCVAPDYVLVHEAVEDRFIEKLRESIRAFYGDRPIESPDFGRIVNERHLARLSKLLADGDIACGGEVDVAQRYMAPTVLRNVNPESPVMTDEVFGPILPVIRTSGAEEAVAFIRARPKPLALYVFGRNMELARTIIARTSSGGACINDAFIHLLPHELPFGGVGASGMGAYHGKASFDTFTHRKSVLERGTFLDPALRYPPYTEQKLKWMKRFT